MDSSPIISGLMIFFSVTTAVVLAYPIVKLAPLWFERRVHARAELHRRALAALAVAVELSADDAEQRRRLIAQIDFNRAALANLVPDDPALSGKPLHS